MPVLSNQQVTLVSGQTTVLHKSRRERCKVKLTGSSGEGTTIPFQRKLFGSLTTAFVDASEAQLSFIQAFPSGTILATTPAGVASLDIVFEVRTGNDA
jgi:hypothetical protein